MWTAKNRGRYDRSKLRYPSDLTDDEWAHVEPLIPPAKRGGNKRHVEVREVMNGIMYILSTGCQWRAIPKDLPPRSGQKGQGQEAPYSRRHAGFAAARHHSSCRYPRPRWRHPASCDPFRDVPFLEKALCRWWLPGAGLSKGLGEDLATARN